MLKIFLIQIQVYYLMSKKPIDRYGFWQQIDSNFIRGETLRKKKPKTQYFARKKITVEVYTKAESNLFSNSFINIFVSNYKYITLFRKNKTLF